MCDAITGVIVGGLLTGSGTWTAMWLQHRKWKIEQKIRILENKRNRLEALSQSTLQKLSICMKEDSYSSEMMSDIDFLFPQSVSKVFNEFMEIEDKQDIDFKNGYYNIAREMKKSIYDIEIEIKELLN
jgi:hypothetical protein